MGILYSPRIPKPDNIVASIDPASSGKGIINPYTNLYSLPENLSGATTFIGPGTTDQWYTFQSTVTSNAGIAPDGTNTATLITDTINGSNITHSVRQQYNHSLNETVTISVFAKPNTISIISLVMSIGNFADGIERGVNFNLRTGQATYTTAATPGYTIENVGNGWWRCSMTYTSTLAALNGVQIRTNNGSSSFYTGNGTGSLYIWGAQLNSGSSPGEYAPQSLISNYNKLVVYSSDNANLNKNSFVTVGSTAPQGQTEFTTPGTFTWTCPTGVTSVSVVCVGGGSGGTQGGTGFAGGDSYFINTGTVRGGGAGASSNSSTYIAGTFTGDGGGNGGRPATGAYSIGGGGAGGYSGAGGNGVTYTLTNGTAGSGGGGGGGGGNASNDGAGGGGVGIYGEGASGAAGIANQGGSGGSGGGKGGNASGTQGGDGGLYGGGGGSATGYWAAGSGGGLGWKNNITVVPGQNYTVVVGAGGIKNSFTAGNGAAGAVRIIWGAGRSFPSTNTSDVLTTSYNPNIVETTYLITNEITATLNSVTYNLGYLDFKGTASSYAVISNTPTTEYITVSAAVYLANWTTASGTFVSNADTDGTNRYQLGINTVVAGSLYGTFNTRNGTVNVSVSRLGIAAGWHIVSAVYDGSTARLYIDGVLVSTNTVGTTSVLSSLNYNRVSLGGKISGTSTVTEFIACRIGVLTIANQAYTDSDALSYCNVYRGRYGV